MEVQLLFDFVTDAQIDDFGRGPGFLDIPAVVGAASGESLTSFANSMTFVDSGLDAK